MAEHGRNRRTRLLSAAGISAAVLVAGGAVTSYATSQGAAPTYVTASVSAHPVTQTLQATGTTQPSSAVTVSFAVSGIVATVPVTMGDKVTAGQVLATLDTTSLKYALATAQGQVANAELTLSQAQSGQVSAANGTGGAAGTTGIKTSSTSTGGTTGTSSVTGTAANTGTGGTTAGTTGSKTSSTSTGGTTGTASSTGSSSHSGTGSTAPITAAQKVLLATVRQADSLLAKTKTDLAMTTPLCSSQTPTPPTTPTPTPPTTPTPTPTGTPPTTPTPTPTGTPPTTPTGTPTGSKTIAKTSAFTSAPTALSTTCIQAQHLVLGDETQLLTLQQGLSGQETALDKLLTTAAASTGTASTGRAPTGTAPTGTAGTSSTGTASAGKTAASGTASTGTATTAKTSAVTGGTGSTTVTVSAAQLAADQSAVDAANANLALAQQQLSQATIVSPLTGVISSVGLTVGQQATAGSTTTAVDVIDPTGHGVTLSVDVTKIPQVKVGDKATVVPDGSSLPLAATVSYVAAAPTSSSSTAYNVQLAFGSNPTTLRDGIQAAVTITTSQAVNALAVPTSAVNHRGALDYVLVPNGATTKAQIITVGSVGAIYTQVTGGLTAGQRVVLANPNTPIPTSTVTGRIARITGGVTSGTTGVLGSSAGTSGTRPGG
jgi:multidrug efflux pump subunit AcrA (membrane-fusion protein)